MKFYVGDIVKLGEPPDFPIMIARSRKGTPAKVLALTHDGRPSQVLHEDGNWNDWWAGEVEGLIQLRLFD